jgi:hypothetical protein
LAGKVDEILVDRLNYVPHIRAFAERHGFAAALTDAFFRERKQVIVKALRAAGILHQILF